MLKVNKNKLKKMSLGGAVQTKMADKLEFKHSCRKQQKTSPSDSRQWNNVSATWSITGENTQFGRNRAYQFRLGAHALAGNNRIRSNNNGIWHTFLVARNNRRTIANTSDNAKKNHKSQPHHSLSLCVCAFRPTFSPAKRCYQSCIQPSLIHDEISNI